MTIKEEEKKPYTQFEIALVGFVYILGSPVLLVLGIFYYCGEWIIKNGIVKHTEKYLKD